MQRLIRIGQALIEAWYVLLSATWLHFGVCLLSWGQTTPYTWTRRSLRRFATRIFLFLGCREGTFVTKAHSCASRVLAWLSLHRGNLDPAFARGWPERPMSALLSAWLLRVHTLMLVDLVLLLLLVMKYGRSHLTQIWMHCCRVCTRIPSLLNFHGTWIHQTIFAGVLAQKLRLLLICLLCHYILLCTALKLLWHDKHVMLKSCRIILQSHGYVRVQNDACQRGCIF